MTDCENKYTITDENLRAALQDLKTYVDITDSAETLSAH